VRLWLLKNSLTRKNFASGSPTNDFLSFRDIFYPPSFVGLEETGLFNTHASLQQLTISCRKQIVVKVKHMDQGRRTYANLNMTAGSMPILLPLFPGHEPQASRIA
jgi:hypothetical protein